MKAKQVNLDAAAKVFGKMKSLLDGVESSGRNMTKRQRERFDRLSAKLIALRVVRERDESFEAMVSVIRGDDCIDPTALAPPKRKKAVRRGK